MENESLTLCDLFDYEPKFSRDVKENHLDDLGGFIKKELKKETAECERIARGLKNASLPCDIYVEASDGTAVIVENQYDDSDYDHLGKIITYSIANSESDDIKVTRAIWISERFHIEHFTTVKKINDLCSEKYIDFKIVLLGASVTSDGDSYILEEVLTENSSFICRRGDPQKPIKNQEELDKLLPIVTGKLNERLKGKNCEFKITSKGSTQGNARDRKDCIMGSWYSKIYNVRVKCEFNIPYRPTESGIKVELKLHKLNSNHSLYSTLSNFYTKKFQDFNSSEAGAALRACCKRIKDSVNIEVIPMEKIYPKETKGYWVIGAIVRLKITKDDMYESCAEAVAELAFDILNILDKYILTDDK